VTRVRPFAQHTPLLLVMLSGVSCVPSGPKLHPVSGTVHYEGRPAEGATVILDPLGGAAERAKPTGTVAADGSFTVSTHPHGDGAPAGEYAVLVTWFPADARQTDNPKNKLPEKYADPVKTPLPRVTVRDGSNVLEPIKLTAR
jgi:hypothetical protein